MNDNIIYRYRPLNNDDMESLKNNYLYFSDPSRYNDAFEYSVKFNSYIPCPKDEFKDFDKLNKKLFNISEKDIFQLMLNEEKRSLWKKTQSKRLQNSFENYKRNSLREIYCCCFTKKNNNILLWGHYANGLRGISIGYDKNLLQESIHPDSRLISVNYNEDNSYPTLDLSNYIANVTEKNSIRHDACVKMFATKSKHWEYEEEVRCLYYAPNLSGNKFFYPRESIKEIIFGELINKNLKETIISLYQYDEVIFKEAKRSRNKYELDILAI